RDAIEDAAHQAPDLVVTDFEMPHMNGAEFTRHFRAMPMCYDVPVIVVTAYENKKSRYAALEMGASDFMLSPVDHQEFQARIRNFMRTRLQQKKARERNLQLERRIATNHEQYREEIQETKEFLRQVIDAVPALISVTDRDGRYRVVNSYLTSMSDRSADKIIGRAHSELLNSFDARRHAKLDSQIVETGHALPTFEEELDNAKSGRRTYLTVKSPIRNAKDGGVSAVVNVSIDITDRKRVEKIVAHQQNRLRVILDNIPNFVSATDEEGCFTQVNLAMAGALGTSPEAMIGTKLAGHVTDPDLIASDRAAHEEVLATGRPRFEPEQRFVARDKTIWMQTVKVPFIFSTGEIEVLTVATDITGRKQSMEALSTAKDDAEILSRAKTKFLATMSHELRTPLNHIMGFSEMISAETLGPIEQAQYKTYATDIYKSGDHLLDMIDRILEFSQLEAGEVTIDKRSLDLNRLLIGLMADHKPAAAQRDITLISDLDRDLDLAEGDETLLGKMVAGLISNAIKFTEPGGSVTVRSNSAIDGWAEITIHDTGIGMAKEDIPSAFLPFRQLDAVMSRDFEGTGLGLAMAKQTVKLHGGEIEISSRPGVGTNVNVRLPLRQDNNST
ncbi:MAG: PAS domain S-box protein, partial [Alphaproteobacteria bacterium]|nr:PAS domain S-box protein [Alphaproteobacteria bacterium]